jgi:hypothetical protein
MKKVLFILFLIFLPSICLSDDLDQAIEKKKAAIVSIMHQEKFKAYIQDDKKFCAAFLDDFTNQKGIEYIKPNVEVDNYDDPRLQEYLKGCPSRNFHKVTDYHSHTLQAIVDTEQSLGRALSEEELKEYDVIDFYATKNFKLYKVDIDNDAKNGEEYVLYAEDFYNGGINQYDISGAYIIIDLENCKDRGGFPAGALYNYKKERQIEEYNGIIKYKGKYYVYRLYKDYKKPARDFLELAKYTEKFGIRNSINIVDHTICNYVEKTYVIPTKKKTKK